MRVMKWSAIALAVTAASTQLATAAPFVSDQAEAKGFVEGSTLDLKLRNYYFNRDKKNNPAPGVVATKTGLRASGPISALATPKVLSVSPQRHSVTER